MCMQCHRESNNAVTERMANATEKQQRDKCYTRPVRERKGATQKDVHSIGVAPALEMIMIKMAMMEMRNVVP